ncbi:hypothetical protein Aperf_G00000072844 [Anoplocephala perfoliata]
MGSDYITTAVNGKDLWNCLNYGESLRFSPRFQLALRTSEYEVESLQSRYKEAAEMFTRTSKAAEVFADALNGLCRCLNSLVTPSPKLPIGIDREADIQRIIRSIYSFSNIVNDFSSCVLQSRTVISQADLKLEELQSTRKDFTRAGESVEAAINKCLSRGCRLGPHVSSSTALGWRPAWSSHSTPNLRCNWGSNSCM